MNRKIVTQSILAGIIGVILIALFYFIVLTWVAGDWHHPGQQFLTVWPWMSALLLGFGIQSALFWYTRLASRAMRSQRVAATTAGVSTATMIACCAHHVTDLVSILGISAFSLFLAQYQAYVLMVAILFNVIGIGYMFRMIKRHHLNNLTIVI